MHAVIKMIISYLIGSINFAYCLGRLAGVDISETYDRNLGAGNLYRATHNPALFLAAALLDVLKVALAWLLFGPWGLSLIHI